MKQALSAVALSLLLAACAAAPHDVAADAKEVKMAFDITDGSTQALVTKLTVIDLTRKQLLEKGMTPRMVLSFRGDASYYTQADTAMVKEADRADAAKIAALIRQLKAANGVESLEQCNVPLASRKLKPEGVMQEVKLVQNGWISLAEYQRKGYAYIAP